METLGVFLWDKNVKACNQCGKCCINYSNGGLSASTSEIEAWDNNRPDIFRYVRDGEIWIDPNTGEQLTRCPWLRKEDNQNKYTCEIYDDRPDDCRYYPVMIEDMIRDGCEMLEEQDKAKPKLAQKRLNKLMANSRPPF